MYRNSDTWLGQYCCPERECLRNLEDGFWDYWLTSKVNVCRRVWGERFHVWNSCWEKCLWLMFELKVGDKFTVMSIHDYKVRCILFLQLWVVQGLTSVNGQHDVILNYLDFVVQRFVWENFSFCVCAFMTFKKW